MSCSSVAPGSKRHHEKRFGDAFVLELAEIVDADDIGVHHPSEGAAFLIEQIERGEVLDIQDGLDGDVALHHGVVGSVNDAHAAPTKDLAQFVSLLERLVRFCTCTTNGSS